MDKAVIDGHQGGNAMKTLSERLEREEIKNAVKWVSDQLEVNPVQSVQKLLNKAIFDYDLSPADAEFLLRLFHDRAA
jgi:RNA binding exosome subunit